MSEPVKKDLSELLREHWDQPPMPSAKLRAQVLASIETTPISHRQPWLMRMAFATSMAAALAVGWRMHGVTPRSHETAASLDEAAMGLSLDFPDDNAVDDNSSDENSLYDIAETVALSD